MTTPTTRLQRLRWPLILAALLVFQAAGIIGMVVISARDPSFAVEPDYYQKALAWDQTVQQRDAAAALGWACDVRHAAGSAGSALSVTLRDRLGRPLEGATVRAELYHHARAADRLAIELKAAGSGTYEAPADLSRPGRWQVSLTVTCGPETYVESQELIVGGAGQ